MHGNPDAMRAFFSRVTPAIPELFNMAYAICGSYDLAEYALQYTLTEAWIGESHGGMGFREGLRNTLRRVAVEEALHGGEGAKEFSWDGLTEAGDDPVMALLAAEDDDVRRAAALQYGCGLSAAKSAKLLGMSAARVKELLARFERAAVRRLPPGERRHFEQRLAKSVRRAFGKASEDMPSLGAIYRSFEAEAMEARRPKRLASRIVKRSLLVLLAVLCALLFWLAAVLIQPAPMEEPPQIATEAGQ